MPLPSRSVRMKSFNDSAGSPKNFAPPWFSSTKSWRWMVPTVARVTLPKLCAVLRIEASGSSPPSAPLLFVAGTIASSNARRSFMSISGKPVLVGDPERDVQHAFLHVVEIEHARQQ